MTAHGLRAPWRLGLALALSLYAAGAVAAEAPVPPLRARVTDLTGTLTAEQRGTLERELAAFEARKGSQIAVLILPTTEPETIEQYAVRAFEAAKIGRKGIDDGVLLLVALKDRALKIEVGYGLEGTIPDAVANRVIAEVIVPFFKQGDYYGGVHAGVVRLMRLIDGEPLPPAAARDTSWSRYERLLPFAFVAVFVLGGVLRAMLGRLVGAATGAGISAFVAWLVVGSLFAALVLGVVVFFFTVLGGVRARPGGYGGWSNRGGLGGWGGGWSGGGGGGGGWSGGGGMSGGGGASGRW